MKCGTIKYGNMQYFFGEVCDEKNTDTHSFSDCCNNDVRPCYGYGFFWQQQSIDYIYIRYAFASGLGKSAQKRKSHSVWRICESKDSGEGHRKGLSGFSYGGCW